MQWIDIKRNPPAIGQMVVLKAIDVKFRTIQRYTSDPWCGWLNIDGTYARWPHKEFEPTHYCILPEDNV